MRVQELSDKPLFAFKNNPGQRKHELKCSGHGAKQRRDRNGVAAAMRHYGNRVKIH